MWFPDPSQRNYWKINFSQTRDKQGNHDKKTSGEH